MVDLSKHMQRANKAIKSRNYDLAIQVCLECQEVDPANLENYEVLLDAARRRQKEGGKKSLFASANRFMSKLSKDSNKKLTTAVKAMSLGPDDKALGAVGDAAYDCYEDSGNRGMAQVAIYFYEEARRSGLFNEQVLWNLGHVYHSLFSKSKEPDHLEQAIKAIAELKRNKPNHPDAGRTLQNWEALRSMTKRASGSTAQDYRSQLASDESAKRNEMMGRIIRTKEDADEVLAFVDKDLEQDPDNKQLWNKKGDVLRRIKDWSGARAAYQKAAESDQHDFNMQIAVGDCDIAMARERVEEAQRSGGDVAAARQELQELELAEYRKRAERQPTEGRHRYHLGTTLLHMGDIDGAAAELQKAVGDARYKRDCHRLLGQCFIKKKIYDLAIDQFSSYIAMTDDLHGDEAKSVLYNRARLYEQIGKTDQAKDDYRKLVEIDLGYKDAADRLSQLG
ncbi:MAG: tetratricopeptide repeat protein [Planctomycetota bacterium]